MLSQTPAAIAQRRRRAKPEARAIDREYMRAKRLANGGSAVESARQQEERRNPGTWARIILRNIKHRAKRKGLEFALVPADLALPEVCPVLGIPLVVGCLPGALNPNSPSVDRLDSSKGYTPENVRVISLRANLLKKDATLAEMVALVDYMVREGAP